VFRKPASSESDGIWNCVLAHLDNFPSWVSWRNKEKNEADDITEESGLCKLGTPNTIFGLGWGYYQNKLAHKWLYERVAKPQVDTLEEVFGNKCWHSIVWPKHVFYGTHYLHCWTRWASMMWLQEMTHPWQWLWTADILMTDILVWFMASHHAVNWEQSLTTSNALTC